MVVCLRKKGVPEGYVTIIQDMYNDCETLASTRGGDAEYFQLRIGLYQGSAEAHMYPMAEFLREEVEMVWTCADAR